MASAQMTKIVAAGHQPHAIDTKKYGAPKVALYWANRKTFSYPGVYLWIFKKQIRMIPLPKKRRNL
jgi:hypothetical protein